MNRKLAIFAIWAKLPACPPMVGAENIGRLATTGFDELEILDLILSIATFD